MKLKYDFEMIELDGQLVAVPSASENTDFSMLRLNETAARIFDLLKNDVTYEEITDILCGEYNSGREEISDYVHQYIGELSKLGIIE